MLKIVIVLGCHLTWGTGGNLGLNREYRKKLFGPLFYTWWNCPLKISPDPYTFTVMGLTGYKMNVFTFIKNCTHAPGGALRYTGGPHLSYVFRGRRGLFLRPPHVRDFVKEGYFLVPRYEVWGSKSPCNPRNITRL